MMAGWVATKPFRLVIEAVHCGVWTAFAGDTELTPELDFDPGITTRNTTTSTTAAPTSPEINFRSRTKSPIA